MMNQEQLDEIIRGMKGSRAVEELAFEDRTRQKYVLDDDSILTISKLSGKGSIQDASGRITSAWGAFKKV